MQAVDFFVYFRLLLTSDKYIYVCLFGLLDNGMNERMNHSCK